MKILLQYVKLMKLCENRIAPVEGENHHVFPKSIYGKNPRMVRLSYLEHLEAHRLLWLGFRERYGSDDYRTIKMAKAYNRTTHNQTLTPDQVSEARKAISESMTGKNNPMFGKPGTFLGKKHSEHSINLLKKSKAARPDLMLKAAIAGGKASQEKRTPEQRSLFAAKAGAATKGISKGIGYKWYNDGNNEKKLAVAPQGWMIGRIAQSSESSKKKSIANKGRKFQSVVCPHCNKTGAKPVMTRFHFDFCRFSA